MMDMSPEDREALCEAVLLLESPGWAARIANLIGQPVEKILGALPANVTGTVQQAVRAALAKSLDVAVHSLVRSRRPMTKVTYKLLTAGTGAAGGAFGLAGLWVELPLTTTLMLRSIASIARKEGEDLEEPESRLACLMVLALGGRSPSDDASEIGYFAVRAMLARAMTEAAQYIAERGIATEGAPVLVRLLATVAERFGVVVSEKAAAASVPVAGAIGGAAVNAAFMDHFQKMAQGHFTVRRLERAYGEDAVREEYERIRATDEHR